MAPALHPHQSRYGLPNTQKENDDNKLFDQNNIRFSFVFVFSLSRNKLRRLGPDVQQRPFDNLHHNNKGSWTISVFLLTQFPFFFGFYIKHFSFL